MRERLVVATLLSLLAGPAAAQDTPQDPPAPPGDGAPPAGEEPPPPKIDIRDQASGRIQIELRDAPLKSVLRAFAARARFNLILRDDVPEVVTLSFPDIELQAAFDRLLDTYGYEKRVEGDVVVVARNFKVERVIQRSPGRYDIDLENMPLGDALRRLSSRAGSPILVRGDADEVVSLHLTDSTIDDAIASLLETHRYVALRRGASKLVVRENDPDAGALVARTYSLSDRIDIAAVEVGLRRLITERGTVEVLRAQRTVFLRDTETTHALAAEYLRSLDRPRVETRVFRIRHRSVVPPGGAAALQAALRALNQSGLQNLTSSGGASTGTPAQASPSVADSNLATSRIGGGPPLDASAVGAGGGAQALQSGLGALVSGTEADLVAQVARLLSANGTIAADVSTNTIMVSDEARILDLVADLIALLDRAPRQVMIEVRVLEVTLEDGMSTGVSIDWNENSFSANQLPAFFGNPSSFNRSYGLRLGQGEFSEGLVVGLARGLDPLDVTIQALATNREVKILASPSISMEDNIAGNIQIVERIPYIQAQQQVTVGPTGFIGSTQTIQFEVVGITLAVTPRILPSDVLRLTLQPTVSSVQRRVETPETGGLGPLVVSSRTASTTVRVENRRTVVVGGLIKTERRNSERRVPILSSIPLVGELFKSADTEEKRSELVILIRPIIFSEDARDASEIIELRRSGHRLDEDEFGSVDRNWHNFLTSPYEPNPETTTRRREGERQWPPVGELLPPQFDEPVPPLLPLDEWRSSPPAPESRR